MAEAEATGKVSITIRELLDLLARNNHPNEVKWPPAPLEPFADYYRPQAPVPLTDPSVNVERRLDSAVERLDDLGELRFKYTSDMATLRALHSHELSNKETERLNAIRAVDTGAVAEAARVQSQQAATLATTQSTIADTLRGQVQAAATATATALATALQPITKSIEDLRQAQYQQQGERVQRTDTTATYRWVVPTIIAGFGCLVAFGALIATIAGVALTAIWLHGIHVF